MSYLQWLQDYLSSLLQSFTENSLSSLTGILRAMLLLLVGWFVARSARFLVIKLLNLVKFNRFAERVKATEMLSKANLTLSPTNLVANFAYWIVLLLFVVTASDSLGWVTVSEQIGRLIAFIPTLLSGITLFIIGAYIAGFLRDVINATTASIGLTAGRLMGSVVYYFLMSIITLTALKQIGIDTSIITSNIVLIMGAVLLSASISYGLASKNILENILSALFSRRTFTVGQTIRIDNITGTIVKIDTIYIVIQTSTERVVIPTKEFTEKKVYIISE